MDYPIICLSVFYHFTTHMSTLFQKTNTPGKPFNQPAGDFLLFSCYPSTALRRFPSPKGEAFRLRSSPKPPLQGRCRAQRGGVVKTPDRHTTLCICRGHCFYSVFKKCCTNMSEYDIICSLPYSNLVTERRCGNMSILSFLLSVLAGVVANYIFAMLTSNNDDGDGDDS